MSEVGVSVILPVHNQEDHLEALVASYVEVLDRLPVSWEVLLVLNACRDGSLDIAAALSAGQPAIRVVETPKGGWGRAVRLGLRESAGELVCYTNSARTTPRELSLCILYAIVNSGVVVKANRKIRESWKRRLGSLAYNLECRALFDLSHWDINGTPKVFPRTFEDLLELKQDDDLIDAEFAATCRLSEYPMLEVPIFSTRRHGGRSTTNYGSAWGMYIGAFKLRRRLRVNGRGQ